jgi:hypothetical protein
VYKNGKPLKNLPQPILNEDKKSKTIMYDNRFPKKLPVKPFDLLKYIKDTEKTGDLTATIRNRNKSTTEKWISLSRTAVTVGWC